MSEKLYKDYIWECDYGVRKPLVPVLKKLLEEQDVTSLQMVTLFVNNIPYCLELYAVLSYNAPQEGHIETMIDELSKLGIKYRPDITFDELINEQFNRRFDATSLSRAIDVDSVFEPGFCCFPEKADLKKKGYVINPLGRKTPVFLSHSSNDKIDIENLIPYLNGAGLPVWFDEISIDYGESITEAIEKGIDKSGAVIFWVTKNFLNSNWCKTERRSFTSRHSSFDNVLIISVISEDIDISNDIPVFLRDLKAFRRKKDESLENIAKEILPVLTKYLDKQNTLY